MTGVAVPRKSGSGVKLTAPVVGSTVYVPSFSIVTVVWLQFGGVSAWVAGRVALGLGEPLADALEDALAEALAEVTDGSDEPVDADDVASGLAEPAGSGTSLAELTDADSTEAADDSTGSALMSAMARASMDSAALAEGSELVDAVGAVGDDPAEAVASGVSPTAGLASDCDTADVLGSGVPLEVELADGVGLGVHSTWHNFTESSRNVTRAGAVSLPVRSRVWVTPWISDEVFGFATGIGASTTVGV
jgi:hypothetical protein